MSKEPGIPVGLLKGVTVHLDKSVSWETVKLLGVPFTWGGCQVAFKHEHTPEGSRWWQRRITPSESHIRAEWDSLGEGVEDLLQDTTTLYCLHPVEFEEEN